MKKGHARHYEDMCNEENDYNDFDPLLLQKAIRVQRNVKYGEDGIPYETIKKVMEALQGTNDRQVVVWYDQKGNAGKSRLTAHLYETGQAWTVQAQDNVWGIVQDVASKYIDGGWRPIVVIDIPRTWKWTLDLNVAIERIKDGLIKDAKYPPHTVNIAGVKVLVTCNIMPMLDKLSKDRWIVVNSEELL